MNQITSMSRPTFLPDNFTLSLIGTLVVASLLPVPRRGGGGRR